MLLCSDEVTFFRVSFSASYLNSLKQGQQPVEEVVIKKFPQHGYGKTKFGPLRLRLYDPEERVMVLQYLARIRTSMESQYRPIFDQMKPKKQKTVNRFY